MLPRAILANIFLVSHLLVLFLLIILLILLIINKLQKVRNSESIYHLALGTVRQQLYIIY